MCLHEVVIHTKCHILKYLILQGKLRKKPKLDNPTVFSEKSIQMKDNHDTTETEIEESMDVQF